MKSFHLRLRSGKNESFLVYFDCPRLASGGRERRCFLAPTAGLRPPLAWEISIPDSSTGSNTMNIPHVRSQAFCLLLLIFPLFSGSAPPPALHGQAPKPKPPIGEDPGLGKDPEKDVLLRSIRQRQAYNRGRLIVSGEVVDEDGKALRNVQLKVPKSRSADHLAKLDAVWESQDHSNFKLHDLQVLELETLIVNKSFKVDIKNADTIHIPLAFTCEGHYPKSINLGFWEREDFYEYAFLKDISVLADMSKMPKEFVREEKLRIVLEKRGPVTQLVERYLKMELTVKGPDKFVLIGPNDAGLLAQEVFVPKGKEIPARTFYAEVPREKDGSIPTIKVGGDLPATSRMLPKGLKLKINAPDSGFIPARPRAGKRVGRVLTPAPEKNYQPELSFAQFDLQDQHKSQTSGRNDWNGGWFFFKLGDRYGRGCFCGVRVSDDGSKMEVQVSISIQPDGSRNLETD
jgi:hypothetical protein